MRLAYVKFTIMRFCFSHRHLRFLLVGFLENVKTIMAKVLLTKEELLELDHLLIRTYAFFRELRDYSPIARLIHYPSVPSAFSESLTIHCAERFFGNGWTGKFGGSTCDVILEKVGEQRLVEVKATGQTNFQEFKLKDLTADFLVWVDFGNRYIGGGNKFDIYILSNPKQYFKRPLRLKLNDFFRQTEGSTDFAHIKAESLQKLLGME